MNNKKKWLLCAIATSVIVISAAVPVAASSQSSSLSENPEITTFSDGFAPISDEEYAEICRLDGLDTNKTAAITTAVGEVPVTAARNISYAITDKVLSGAGSHEVTFDMDGWWGQPDHNTVSFKISNFSGKSYTINLVNETTGQVRVNGELKTGNYSFRLGPISSPTDKWKFVIVNSNATEIKFDLSITSCIL